MGAFHVLKDMAKVAVAAASLGALPRLRTCFPPLPCLPPLLPSSLSLFSSLLFSVWQHGPLIDAKRPLELRLNFNFLPHKRHLSAPLFYLPHSLSGRLICPQTVAGPRQASVSISPYARARACPYAVWVQRPSGRPLHSGAYISICSSCIPCKEWVDRRHRQLISILYPVKAYNEVCARLNKAILFSSLTMLCTTVSHFEPLCAMYTWLDAAQAVSGCLWMCVCVFVCV